MFAEIANPGQQENAASEVFDVCCGTGLLFVKYGTGLASPIHKKEKTMRPGSNDGPFPKSVFPTSVFPRRIFPWMGGDDEEDDTVTSDGKREQDDDDDD